MQADYIPIKQAAEQSGMTEHTLRYYERIGLLQVKRQQNGYRMYAEHDIAWLAFIQRLKVTGMPLKDIAHLIELRALGPRSLPERQQLIIQHRKSVLEKIAQLKNELRKIDEKIEYYNKL